MVDIWTSLSGSISKSFIVSGLLGLISGFAFELVCELDFLDFLVLCCLYTSNCLGSERLAVVYRW